MVKLKIYWLRDRFIICHFFHPRWRRFDPTVHHPFRFARTRPIQQETNPGIQGHDTTISCPWSRSWIDVQGNGFFCMLGLYKRQSRAEARGGSEGEEHREKKHSNGGEKNKTQKPDEEPELKKKKTAIQSKKRHKFTERRRERGGATQRRISLAIVFILAEKQEPEVSKKTQRKSAYPLPSSLVHLKNWEEDRTVDTAGRRQRTRTKEESRE